MYWGYSYSWVIVFIVRIFLRTVLWEWLLSFSFKFKSFRKVLDVFFFYVNVRLCIKELIIYNYLMFE